MQRAHECPSCGARWQHNRSTRSGPVRLELVCPSGHRTVVDAPVEHKFAALGPRRARRWTFVGGPADGLEELRPQGVAAPDEDVWRQGASYRLERANRNAYVFEHLRPSA